MTPNARLRLMTYNVHGCVGTDRQLDPVRIAEVIRSEDVDVVALQELDVERPRSLCMNQPAVIAAQLGYRLHFTSARDCAPGNYGNAVLSRWPFELRSEGLLPWARGEQRAVQWVRVTGPGGEFDLLNTHLDLNRREREGQVEALLSAEWLAHEDGLDAVVVCGDLNAGPNSKVCRRLREHLSDTRVARGWLAGRTFPSALPLLRLDHVLVSARFRVHRFRVASTPLSRKASDHLPIVVDLELASAKDSERTVSKAEARR
jgi:endonuclease/exonuclease/phosphatase family metal-dependent hydrolase